MEPTESNQELELTDEQKIEAVARALDRPRRPFGGFTFYDLQAPVQVLYGKEASYKRGKAHKD